MSSSVEDAHQAGRLNDAEAETLRSLASELDTSQKAQDFMLENCLAFASYAAEGEQQLEWTALHNEYQALVEKEIEGYLGDLGVTSEQLYDFLQRVVGDGIADAFVTKLLSYSSYGRFCEAQRGLAQELLAEPQVAEEPECVEMKEMWPTVSEL